MLVPSDADLKVMHKVESVFVQQLEVLILYDMEFSRPSNSCDG